jgi:Protein of unknown function (DUF2721)
MGTSPDRIVDVAKSIKLALAPVFLLTGIAGLLNVMAGRLSRIIDRGRKLTETRDLFLPPFASVEGELRSLERRRYFTSIAISACTIAALLLCTVIATLFVEVVLNAAISELVAVLFVASTLALIIGLSYFLREVQLATRIRLTPPKE